MNELNARYGNYFWDPQNNVLVIWYSEKEALVDLGSATTPKILVNKNNAFPIQITKDLLVLLGFIIKKGKFEYKNNDGKTIVVNCDNGIYTFGDRVVVYLHELQNAFVDNNLTLNINIDGLIEFLEKN